MLVALSSGALAGILLFAVQHFTVVPLIESAEAYETAAHQSAADEAHDHEAWQPADGWQRTSFTAVATVLSGIGFAALLFGSLPHLIGAPIATGHNAVPVQLIRQFTIASLATTGMFWLLLGTIGGFIYSRNEARRA